MTDEVNMSYLDLFLNGKLAIYLRDATLEQLSQLDAIIPCKWASGDPFRVLDNYTHYDYYAYTDNGRIYYFDANEADERKELEAFQLVTVTEFLYDDDKTFSVTENEIYDLLNK